MWMTDNYTDGKKQQISVTTGMHRSRAKLMSRLFIIVISLFVFQQAKAQTPSWAKKATKSVFTLKTFAKDGTLIGSSTGFFVTDDGEAVSCFTPFRGASRAVVIDSQDKEMEVTYMLGANDTYDVAKFRVDTKKSQPLAIAGNAAEGDHLWMLPYREVKNCPEATVRRAETFRDDYAYYTLSAAMPNAESVGCPLMTANGEVAGLMQQPAGMRDTLTYAVSAAFAASLKLNGLSINDATLKSTDIPKDLPDDLEQANLTLYLASASMDSLSYDNLIETFLRKFPAAPDGYYYRAQRSLVANNFAAAARDMETAIDKSSKKDETHFNYAQMIYQKELYKSDIPYEPWSLDKAFSEAGEACRINEQPIYRQLQAQILFAQKKYSDAIQIYNTLVGGELRSAQLFFEASRCHEMLRDTTAQLAMLDSAVATFSRPYLKEAAPYLYMRAQARLNAGRFRDAVNDMNDYETLMPSGLTDRFYYIRFQAEVGGRLFQQALNDIDRAVNLRPDYDLYYAEKASLQVRVGLYDDAIVTSKECIRQAPDYSDGYLFLGLAQCAKGQKAEGISNLKKAKELGDEQADALIEKYSK